MPSDAFEPFEIPKRVSGRSEEHAPHIIVHADDLVALAVEVLDGLRSYQAVAAGNENFPVFHFSAAHNAIQSPIIPSCPRTHSGLLDFGFCTSPPNRWCAGRGAPSEECQDWIHAVSPK